MDQQSKHVVTVTRAVEAPVQAVWDVLSDGWFYATWVVGASRVRAVDKGWPAEGARIHHSFGIWPTVISDTTHVLLSHEPAELKLKARGWPAGEAEVVISTCETSSVSCTVTIAEDAVAGPGILVPRPVRQMAIGLRNVESLRRLAYLAEGRYRDRVTA